MARPAIQLDLGVRNLDSIVANLFSVYPEANGEFKRLAKKYAGEMEAEVRRNLPKGPSDEHPYSTGFRSEVLTTHFTPSGLVFETGWWAEDFADEPSGRGLFYAPYPEFGTRDMPAQPSLEPAADVVNPQYEAEIRATLRRITRRHNAGR